MGEERKLSLGMIFKGMMRDMIQVYEKRICEQAETQLTIYQFGLLHALDKEDDDVIQKHMAEKLGKDKSVVLRLIDSLEEKELLRRVVDPNDRRKNYLMVTKKGEKVLEQYEKIELELTKELQQGLTKSDIDSFYKVINQIRSNAEKLQYFSNK